MVNLLNIFRHDNNVIMQQISIEKDTNLDLSRVSVSQRETCSNPQNYLEIFQSGERPSLFSPNVCGRVIRGRNEGDFEKLSFIEGRRVAFILGPEGMSGLVGQSGRDIVLGVGKTPEWLSEQLQNGIKWKLVVLPKTSCVLADWNGVQEIIEKVYPEVSEKIKPWYQALKDQSLTDAIDPDLVKSIVKDYPSHPEHRTVESYLAGEDSALNARLFLWHSLGINDQYTGTGYTKPPNGERGAEEYLIENTLISQISEARVIDLEVQ
jgi:hypothetical protein